MSICRYTEADRPYVVIITVSVVKVVPKGIFMVLPNHGK